jgi:renalase
MPTVTESDVLIIGAGMTGLSAAQVLVAKGLKVTILEKSRGRSNSMVDGRFSTIMPLVSDRGIGVGGRMATRRIQGHRFDHGAQYFTARDPEFIKQVHHWLENAVVCKWFDALPLSSGKMDETPIERYVTSTEGMTQIPKYMARECGDALTVKPSTEVKTIEKTATGWLAHSVDGETYAGKSLLITAPLPQTLELLERSGLMDDYPLQTKQLATVHYTPCIALMVLCETQEDWPTSNTPGIKFDTDSPVSWIGDNTHKYGSPLPNQRAFTVHSTPEFAMSHFDADETTIFQALFPHLEKHYSVSPWRIIESQLHRWRYACPHNMRDDLFCPLDTGTPLYIAGDSFGNRARLEGAWCSGYAAGHALVDALTHRSALSIS